MKIDYLINKIEELINASSTNFEFKIYDSLKMDNEKMDINKINGIARVTGGGFEPIANLGQGSVTISVEFIYPYERLDAVNETLQNVAKGSAGLVVENSIFSEELQGTTGIAITYPIQGNYYNGTMGETAKSRLVCYFDINEKAVLSNDVKIGIVNGYEEANKELKGEYFILENSTYKEVTLPKDYEENTQYYIYKENAEGLPKEYRQVDGLLFNIPKDYENVGYINLGIMPNQDTSLELEYDISEIHSNNFIVGNNSLNGSFDVWGYSNGNIMYGFGSQTNMTYNISASAGQNVKIKLGKETYINDELATTFEVEDFSLDKPIWIGTWAGTNDVPNANCSSMKVLKCNIYQNDVLTNQFVPCYRIVDNKAGFYDIIEKKFVESVGNVVKGEDFYEEVNKTLNGVYFTRSNDKYTRVVLPQDYTGDTQYYQYSFEDIPYYKYVITRHRLSTTNKYENNVEMKTVNDGQSIDFSLAVPSVKGSVINKIKDDMLLGLNTQKAYVFKFVDESGKKIFENMIASGDFSYEIVPGDTVIFKILFVYKR